MITKAAIGVSALRVLFGAAYLVAPGRSAGSWIGATASREPSRMLARGFGVRDLVLGGGSLYALAHRRSDPRPWFAAQAIAEASDCATTLATSARLPRSGYLVGAGLTGLSTGVALAAAATLRPQTDSDAAHV